MKKKIIILVSTVGFVAVSGLAYFAKAQDSLPEAKAQDQAQATVMQTAAAPDMSAIPMVSVPDFTVLSERLLPTVVNVSTVQKEEDQSDVMALPDLPEGMPQFPPGSPFEEFFKEFRRQQQQGGQRAIPMPPPTALGSGFIIDAEKGYVVTNNHVVKDAEKIKVILHNEKTLDAKLIGTDEKTDLAVLQIETKEPVVAAPWGNSDDAKVGSWVLAIGNPFGLGGSVTSGIVSARQRDINAGPYDDFIQSDAAINRGNSGGPMFNMKGEVIGINTAIFSPSGGSIGIGFAVPSSLARPVVEQLIKYGKTKRGWIGVRIQAVTDDIADSLGLDKARGALVAGITKDGPAEKTGLKMGDVILKFNNQDIPDMRALPRIVAETEIDQSVPIQVWRDGKVMNFEITTGRLEQAEESGLLSDATPKDKPADPAETKGQSLAALGVDVAPISEGLRKLYNIKPEIKGVAILNVAPKSDALTKGLVVGDVIVEIDQTAIETVSDLEKALAAAKKEGRKSVLLFVSNADDLRFVAVRLAE